METLTSEDNYERPFSLLLFLTVSILVGMLIGSGLVVAVAKLNGMDMATLLGGMGDNPSLLERNLVRSIAAINHAFTFVIPATVVAVITLKKQVWGWLRLNIGINSKQVLLGVIFMFAVFPIAQLTYWLNTQLPLPEWATNMEDSTQAMLKGLLIMESPFELLFNLFVIAFLAAVGEELVFRGFIQQVLDRHFNNAIAAIWVTGFLFSAIHFQFEGFLPRMVLGAGLGYLFYYTKNLWIPIIAHFVNNAIQVVAQYVLTIDITEIETNEPELLPLSIASIIGLGIIIYIVPKLKSTVQV